MKIILKLFIICFGILVLTLVVYGLVYEGVETNAVKKQDDLFMDNLMTLYDAKLSKGEIYFYKAENGIGVMLLKHKFFIGWQAELIDKLYYCDGGLWKYIEVETNDAVIPILYGFVNRNVKESIFIKVKNEIDNIDEQANANEMYDEVSWFMLLDMPLKHIDDTKIYNIETDELLYK